MTRKCIGRKHFSPAVSTQPTCDCRRFPSSGFRPASGMTVPTQTKVSPPEYRGRRDRYRATPIRMLQYGCFEFTRRNPVDQHGTVQSAYGSDQISSDAAPPAGRLHVGFCVAAGTAGNLLQGGIEFPVMAVVTAVDPEDNKTGWQTAEQFVIVQFK